MINQKSSAVSADQEQYFLESQVNLFLFDLKNEASEHGFRQGESWALTLATEQEMLSLKRFHHPVVSLRLQPATLLKVYQRVKSQLNQSISTTDAALTSLDLTRTEKTLLAAYPFKHTR